MNFQHSKTLPKTPQKTAAKQEVSMPNYMDQIHDLIGEGHSVQEIHKAIDAHPDMYNKDAFKAYVAHMHPVYTEHLKSKVNKKDANA